MKFIVWMVVIIISLYWFFPEVGNSLKCFSQAGSFNYANGVCSNISEKFCVSNLKGRFGGCTTECKEDKYSIKTCEAKCSGNCKTKTYDERDFDL